MHRPVAVATFIVSLVIPLFSAAYAQSNCPPPTPPPITLQNAEICAWASDNASTTTGLASYSWSIAHGTVIASDNNGAVSFSSDGSGDVVLSVTVTDTNGCPATNSVTLPLHSISSPTITAPAELCPNGSADLGVSAPGDGGSWASVNWMVTNGYFQSDSYPYQTQWANGPTARVYSNGTGPTTVSVDVMDSQGCRAQASATIGVRSIQPPIINAPAELCPNGSGDLSVEPPAEGGAWQYVSWSVTNGYFQTDTYPYQTQWANGPTVRVYSNGTGPTTVSVDAQDSQGCRARASATIGVRSIQPPVITAPAELCPNASGDLSVAPPAEGGAWQYVSWSVTNGYFQTDTYPYQTQWANGPTVRVYSNGTGPTTVSVDAQDSQGCRAQASATIGVRSIQPPVITAPAQLCPNGSGDLSVAPPAEGGTWQYVSWSVTNGYFQTDSYPYQTQWANGPTVRVYSNGTGPTAVSVDAQDSQGCRAQASATIGVTQISAPPINVASSVCTGVNSAASVDGTWTQVNWAIDNGSFIVNGYKQSWASGPNVLFTPNGSDPVTLYAGVSDAGNCQAGSSVTVPISTPVPVISVGTLPVPTNTTDTAQIDTSYTAVQWSVTHGTIVSGGNSNSVTFQADGTGPVTLSVTATDSNGCSGTASAEYTVAGQPVAITAPSSFCSASAVKNATAFSNGTITNVQWTIANGTITSGANAMTVSFTPSSFNDITLTLNANVNGTPETATQVIPYIVPTMNPTVSTELGCPYVNVNITLPNYADFASITGQAVNGFFGGTYGDGRYFAASNDATKPLTVTLEGHTADDCIVTWTHTFQTPHVPDVAVSVPAICDSKIQTATLTNAADFDSTSFYWQITNGSFYPQPSGSVSSVSFFKTGTADVVLWVSARGLTDSCSVGKQVTVPVYAPPPTPTITASALTFCPGGSVTLTASSGASYQWSTGQTTQSITVNIGGGYGVGVADAHGCVSWGYITVDADLDPRPFITAIGPLTVCPGGRATLTSTAAASYLWSDGETTQSITVGPGSYSVTVTDAAGCSATSIVQPVYLDPLLTTPVVTASGPTTFCAGGSVTLTAPLANAYLWSNGATTRAITVNTTGAYSVTVTDGWTCNATSAPTAVTVNSLSAAINASGPTTFCAGGSVTLTATSGASYLWSTGATTQSIVVTAAGNYSVAVTDSNGCRATSAATTVVVNALPAPAITASGATTFCAGGSVTLTASSASSYLWSNGATTQAITVNTSGNYSVTVTDANGCSATSAPVTVTNATIPKPIIVADETAICPGGGADLTAPAGYAYLWSTGATTQSIIVPVGSYTVQVTNAQGCSATSDPVTITVKPAPTVTISASANNVCAGSTVRLTASATGGTGVYTSYQWYDNYNWIATTTVPTLDLVPPGGHSYSVIAVDANQCGGWSSPVRVDTRAGAPPVSISISTNGRYPGCPSSGATLSIYDPAQYTSFLWSTGATTPNLTVYSPGTYTVTATTANGCSATGSQAVLFLPPAPKPTISVTGSTTICQFQSVTLTSSPAASYWWSDGERTQSITYTPAGVSGSIPFYVIASDTNGCSTQSDTVYIQVNRLPDPIVSVTLDNVCGTHSATLDVHESGSRDTTGDTYLWSNGATQKSIIVTTPGLYDVTVTSANGCSTRTNSTNVVFNAPLQLAVTPPPATSCPGTRMTLTATPSGGVPPYQYRWSSNDPGVSGWSLASVNVSPLQSYSYTVTVSDSVGCQIDNRVDVNVSSPAVPVITPSGSITYCADGNVTLTSSPAPSYLWSNGATTQSITVNGSGNYTVTVTDANGCRATSAPTNLTPVIVIIPTISASGATTFCAGGSVTLTSSSATSYHWSNGATTQSITVNASGNYSVTIADLYGCTATSAATSVTVNPLPTPTINASGATTFCAGGSVTLTASSASSYLWSNGATTQSIIVNASGNYSVTVRDANGCSAASDPTTVTVFALPTPTISASGATSFCAGGSVTLTASSASSYHWSNGATTQAITVNTSGNYSVTVTDGNGCSATSAATSVTVDPLPTPTINASGATTFCAGGSVELTSTYASSYLWSNGATTRAIDVGASGNYSVTVTDAYGCSATSAATPVTVNSTPAPTISAPAAICAGATGSASTGAISGATYVWTITNGTITSGAGTNAITFTSGYGPVWFGLTVTTSSNCSGTANATVNVNATPYPTITAPAAICSGASGSASVASVAGATYNWTITNGTITGGSGTNAITFTSTSGPVLLGVTVASAQSCSASSSTSVTVTSNPSPTITAPAAICTGATGSASTAAIGGASYAWTIANGTITGGNGTNAITFTSTSGSVSLGVTVTAWTSCSGSANATVNVNALPNATITAPAAICSGASGSASVAAIAGATYAWTITNGTITGGSGTNAITFTSSSGPVSLGVSVSSNGCDATGSTSVTVNPLPNATITAPSAICSGSTGTASVAAVTGASYSWSIAGGTITGGSGTNVVTFTSTGTNVSLSITVTTQPGCAASSSTNVAVNANPATPTITPSGATTFCQGGSVTLSAPAASSYHWSDGETTQSIVVTTSGTFWVTVTNASGCTSAQSASTTVTVNPATAITQQPASITITRNTTTTLSVTATGTGTLSYQWYNPPTANNNDTSKKVGTNSPTFTTPKLGHGTYYYYVVVTGSCGTVRSAIATVTAN